MATIAASDLSSAIADYRRYYIELPLQKRNGRLILLENETLDGIRPLTALELPTEPYKG